MITRKELPSLGLHRTSYPCMPNTSPESFFGILVDRRKPATIYAKLESTIRELLHFTACNVDGHENFSPLTCDSMRMADNSHFI